MDNEIQNNDIAFSNMLNELELANEVDKRIADIVREYNGYQIKKDDHLKRVRQYAANYFSKEKISELHRLCLEVLKSSEFNEEDYIEKFSDATKIEIDDINFLIEIQNNIIEIQENLNSNMVLSSDDHPQIKGMSKIMSAIADILARKDGANDD